MELKLNEKKVKSLVYKLSAAKTLTIFMNDGEIIDAQVANIIDPMKYDVGRCQDSKKINNDQNCISKPHTVSTFKEICQNASQKIMDKNQSGYWRDADKKKTFCQCNNEKLIEDETNESYNG